MWFFSGKLWTISCHGRFLSLELVCFCSLPPYRVKKIPLLCFFTLERSELQDVWKRLFHNFPIVQFFHNVLLPELPQVPTAIPAPVPNEVDGDILLAMPWTSTVSSPLTVGKFVVYLIDDQRIRGYPNKIYSWEDHWRLQPLSTWKGKHVASDFAMSNVFFPLLRSWQEALPGLWRSWGADGPMETCSHHHLFEAKTTGLSGHLMSVEDHKRATAYACNESFKWRLKTWGKQSPTLTLEKMWSTWQVVSKVGLGLSEMCIFDTCHFEPLWSILGANSQVESQRACAITKASYGWCGRQILRGKAIHADDGAYKAAIILQQ